MVQRCKESFFFLRARLYLIFTINLDYAKKNHAQYSAFSFIRFLLCGPSLEMGMRVKPLLAGSV